MPCLVLWNGDQQIRRVSLAPGRTIIGRGDDADVPLPLPLDQISRRHCYIEGQGHQWYVVDLSTNGTFLNGARLEPRVRQPLTDADRLEVGPLRLVFHNRVPARRTAGPTRRKVTAPPVAERPHAWCGELIGDAAAMRVVYDRIRKIAPAPVPVLIRGESGTGKELVARALHHQGPRSGGPFLAVNAAGLRDALVESELFGHEKGAFTGAVDQRDGAFHHADGGTLFLDEIGELHRDVQARLLRVLQDGEVRRVGGSTVEHPDVRVVAATHQNLEAMCADGRFREDLFHRIAVCPIELPPLRARRSDILQLVDAFLASAEPPVEISDAALGVLVSHPWPGNVRQLHNRLTAAIIESEGARIEPAHLGLPEPDPRAIQGDEALLRAVVARAGTLTGAARVLGVPRNTLRHWLRKHEIEVPGALD